jgi:hypothetical protein
MLVNVGRYFFLFVKCFSAIGGYVTLDVCGALFSELYCTLTRYVIVLLKVSVGVFLC